MANKKRLIDANALIEKLQADFKKVFHNAGQKVKPEDYYITRKSVYDADLFKAEVDGFCDLINCQPTVDAVEVVHGRFELIEKAGCDYYCCSECGKILGGFYAKPEDNFCPNCGAKMDGGAEDGM